MLKCNIFQFRSLFLKRKRSEWSCVVNRACSGNNVCFSTHLEFNLHIVSPYIHSALFMGQCLNSTDSDHNAASDQGIHYLLTQFSIKIPNELKILPNNPKTGNELVQLTRNGKYIRLKWVRTAMNGG